MLKILMLLLDSIKKIGKIQDTMTVGLLGGLIGTIFMDISNSLIFAAGKTETLYGYIVGGLFVPPFKTKQRKNFIVGEIGHFMIGSIWGIPLTYILKKTGKDHHLLKGVFISVLSLGSLIGGQKAGVFKKFGLTKTFYSAFWNHLVYGIVSAQAIVWLANPKIFKTSNNKSEDFRRFSSDCNSPELTEFNHESLQPSQPSFIS